MSNPYAICEETKCKVPVYSKEQIDGKFALVEASRTFSGGMYDSVTAPLPDGFTKNNCVVLSLSCSFPGYAGSWAYNTNGNYLYATLNDSNIELGMKSDSSLKIGKYSFRALLYKFSDDDTVG